MNRIEMDGYIRISKQEARKRFDSGEDIRITPCKCRPVDKWFGLSMTVNTMDWGLDDIAVDKRFDLVVNNFTVFNCNAETGYYPAFYTEI